MTSFTTKEVINDSLLDGDEAGGQVDAFRHAEGAKIGCMNKGVDPGNLKNLILLAINNGKMNIISKTNLGFFVDCSGNIIDMSLYFNKWKSPKCLIPSNVQKVK